MTEIKKYSKAAQIWALREYGEAGPRTFRALMARFLDTEAIHSAEISELEVIEGLGEKRSVKIFESSKYLDEAEAFIGSLESKKARCSTLFDPEHPALLEELNDPPPIIFYRGTLPVRGEKTVAVVGSHKASPEGVTYAVDLGVMFAQRSVSVVSGLARGIDISAHIGALRGGGRTYAVIGSGINNVFPEEHKEMAVEITRHGALISEYPPDSNVSTGRLMARNRLIVGLSQAVVICEILPDSKGTMDTAMFCHQLGKIMFILLDGCDAPGRDNSGVEKIIEMGAIPFYLKDGTDIILKSLV
ncbi:MAG: DNA-processing protein DprA [Candidatus Zixiibacteriota bacterium]